MPIAPIASGFQPNQDDPNKPWWQRIVSTLTDPAQVAPPMAEFEQGIGSAGRMLRRAPSWLDQQMEKLRPQGPTSKPVPSEISKMGTGKWHTPPVPKNMPTGGGIGLGTKVYLTGKDYDKNAEWIITEAHKNPNGTYWYSIKQNLPGGATASVRDSEISPYTPPKKR